MRYALFLLISITLASCLNHQTIFSEKRADFEKTITIINENRFLGGLDSRSINLLIDQIKNNSLDSSNLRLPVDSLDQGKTQRAHINLNLADDLDEIDINSLKDLRTIMQEVPIVSISIDEGFIAYTLDVQIGVRSGLIYYRDEKKPSEVNTGGLSIKSRLETHWYYWAS